jgi:hypothetical protein
VSDALIARRIHAAVGAARTALGMQGLGRGDGRGQGEGVNDVHAILLD